LGSQLLNHLKHEVCGKDVARDPVRSTFQGGLNLEDSVRARHLVRKQPGCSRQHVWFARIHKFRCSVS